VRGLLGLIWFVDRVLLCSLSLSYARRELIRNRERRIRRLDPYAAHLMFFFFVSFFVA
jgi:hypothetical protein